MLLFSPNCTGNQASNGMLFEHASYSALAAPHSNAFIQIVVGPAEFKPAYNLNRMRSFREQKANPQDMGLAAGVSAELLLPLGRRT